MIKITKELIDTIIGVSKNVYPDEFIGLLRKNNRDEISTLLVIPNSTYGQGFSSIRYDMLPLDPESCGSIHSHTIGSARPSSADLRFFSRMGEVHLIIAHPFTLDTLRVYDFRGRELEFEVVKDSAGPPKRNI
jgi:proteasome lid subunit RPN8/RPN11